MAHNFAQPSAPTEHYRPVPPVRSEFASDPLQQGLLSDRPPVPERMDIRPKPLTSTVRSSGNDHEETTTDEHNDCTCNYNRYATKKTIGHILFEVALLTSNAMQLRMLILQKQRDGIWVASLVLVCVSILFQFGLTFLFYLLIKGDIRNPHKQSKLERLNTMSMAMIFVVSIINILVNVMMLSTSRTSFFDTPMLEQYPRRT